MLSLSSGFQVKSYVANFLTEEVPPHKRRLLSKVSELRLFL